MHNSQYIDKQTMQQVRICVAHRQARGEKVKIAQVLNELVVMGLERYAREEGVNLFVLHEREVVREGEVSHGA